MVNSSPKKAIKNGRGKDKSGRKMHPNSLNNLKNGKATQWKPGQAGNPKGSSITFRQKMMMLEPCPFDGRGRPWLEVLAEGGMRQALTTPVALSNLQDRHEGKVTQPVEGSLEIKDARELTDEELAVIAATNIINNNTIRSSRGVAKEAPGS